MAAGDYATLSIPVVTTVNNLEITEPTDVLVAKDTLMTAVLGAKMDGDAGITDADYATVLASS